MTYNIAITNLISTASGTKVLSEPELRSMANGNTASSSVTVSGSEQLSLLVDLKARYNLDKVLYHRTAADSEAISVYARQNDEDVWSEIPTTISGSEVQATLSGTFNKYQTINVVHSVNTGTASPFEIQVYNNDNLVDFGSYFEGSVEDYPLSSGDSENAPQEVFIKNKDTIERDYLTFIEDNPSHSLVQIALTEPGPYYSIRDNSISLPGSYAWSSGSHDGTQVDGSDRVVISASTSGTYYSPVVDISALVGPRIFWDATLSGNSVIDDIQNTNSQYTVGVRIHNVSPEGPWSSGQLSTDYLWDVTSGTLQFVEYANNTILPNAHKNYVQFKVEFSGDTNFPKLDRLGIEYPLSVTISGGQTGSLFARSITSEKTGSAELITWYFEPRPILN